MTKFLSCQMDVAANHDECWFAVAQCDYISHIRVVGPKPQDTGWRRRHHREQFLLGPVHRGS
jgi:hypothetical protein